MGRRGSLKNYHQIQFYKKPKQARDKSIFILLHFYGSMQHKFKRWDSLDGTAHRGRFGLSLASLGDINRDGIDGEVFI